ncbi:hypothetical protein ACQP2P_16060 [Dactylosporangium sp. CA-139114]|uniref:hypothetical protein n=1 Tax=Dactylosporangium sp. CA-139114 TaxID=3239931 RepID=UPI003D96ACA9
MLRIGIRPFAAAVAVLVAGAVLLPAGPAAAHPFGDPQTVVVTLDAQRPDVVHVRWRVGGPDDLTLLGVSLGLLPANRVQSDGTVDVQAADPAVIAASDRFTGYLLQRITVTDGSAPCPGAVAQPIDFLQLKGATTDYTCPGPVATATVAVRMLTDLNPAYKTLATGPGGQRAVYQGATDTHAWTLVGAPPADGAGLGRSAAVQLAAVLSGLLLAAAAVVVVARRMRRRQVTA